jgi:A/G-specific adenine glycosylase
MGSFLPEIYNWFEQNKRDLPWRKTSDPYKIWISEIILQQTRVAQGMVYYNRFVETFPTVFELADAHEDKVLKLWQGLGYYSRARNLHFTAKRIVKNHNGEFPTDYKTILSLKGIGKYTAAAIASIAFNQPYAAVDGNIQRVLSRYFGITDPIDSSKGEKQIQELADKLIPGEHAGLHNQALMEFGALLCTPKSPGCNFCPVAPGCYANHKNLTEQIPRKTKKVKQRNRYFYFFVPEKKDFLFLEKRDDTDIWKNLYQFPLVESPNKLTDEELLKLENPTGFKELNIVSVSGTVKHILTHQKIYARFIHFEIKNDGVNDSKFIRVNKKDIYKFAVPKLLEEYLNNMELDNNPSTGFDKTANYN